MKNNSNSQSIHDFLSSFSSSSNSNNQQYHGGGLRAENMLATGGISLPQNTSVIDIAKIWNNGKQNYNSNMSSIMQPKQSHMQHFEKMEQRGAYDVPNRQSFSNNSIGDSQYFNKVSENKLVKTSDNFGAVMLDLVDMQKMAYKQADSYVNDIISKKLYGQLVNKQPYLVEGKKIVDQMSSFLLKQALNESTVSIEDKNEWKTQGLKYQSYETFDDYIMGEIPELGKYL